MADFLSVAIKGTDALKAKFKALGPALKEAERRTVFRGSELMALTWRRKASGDVLKVRTGAYRASIGTTPTADVAGAFESRVGVKEGAAGRYAAIHETGGVIRAKGKLLAIPTEANRTRAGVARQASPRDFPDGFWITARSGVPIFVTPKGGGRGLDVQFFGVPSVTIPARRPMGRSFDEVRPLIPRIAEEERDSAVRKVVG